MSRILSASPCQPFTEISHNIDSKTLKSVFTYASKRQTSDIRCPFCGKMNVYIHAKHSTEIKDFPYYPKHRQSLVFHYHRYKCRECGRNFSESIPEKIPHARITYRAAEWIKSLLSKNSLFLLFLKLQVFIGKQLRKFI
jgi:transposase